MQIIVSPLSQIERVCEERRPSHLITLLDPGDVIETPKALGDGRRLRVSPGQIAMEAVPFEIAADW